MWCRSVAKSAISLRLYLRNQVIYKCVENAILDRMGKYILHKYICLYLRNQVIYKCVENAILDNQIYFTYKYILHNCVFYIRKRNSLQNDTVFTTRNKSLLHAIRSRFFFKRGLPHAIRSSTSVQRRREVDRNVCKEKIMLLCLPHAIRSSTSVQKTVTLFFPCKNSLHTTRNQVIYQCTENSDIIFSLQKFFTYHTQLGHLPVYRKQ